MATLLPRGKCSRRNSACEAADSACAFYVCEEEPRCSPALEFLQSSGERLIPPVPWGCSVANARASSAGADLAVLPVALFADPVVVGPVRSESLRGAGDAVGLPAVELAIV